MPRPQISKKNEEILDSALHNSVLVLGPEIGEKIVW